VLNPADGDEPRIHAGVRPARPEDLAAVLQLLGDARLPTEGVAEAFDRFVVADRNGEIVAAGGLEAAGAEVLLRSVVVSPTERGRGIGQAIAARLISDARDAGFDRIWLLTETAPEFFGRFGFRAAPRESASEPMRASREFTSCCPSSAIAMSRRARPLRVLVLCTANTARSQLAEALLRHRYTDQVVVESAGTNPGTGPHPNAIATLAERGITWHHQRSKGLDDVNGPWDLAITVCDGAREECPMLPGTRLLHWSLPDPVPYGMPAFRRVAEALDALIEQLWL
jgi:amino-acid N-acetyltransferase